MSEQNFFTNPDESYFGERERERTSLIRSPNLERENFPNMES